MKVPGRAGADNTYEEMDIRFTDSARLCEAVTARKNEASCACPLVVDTNS